MPDPCRVRLDVLMRQDFQVLMKLRQNHRKVRAMKKIKFIAIIFVLAGILSSAMYLSINSRMESAVAAQAPDTEESEYNRPLCERLIRFGQVAYERGQIAEAKHFFQKAIIVDPTHKGAWRKYNLAFLALVSEKVADDPSYLPIFSSDSGSTKHDATRTPNRMSTETQEDNDDDGC